jgi:TRAP-type C4-dicarboxylate transport system substrate-binding protein
MALQRGVVKGAGLTAIGIIQVGHAEFLNYQIMPSFWSYDDHLVFVNADWWDSLPQYARDIIQETVITHEARAYDEFMEVEASEVKALRLGGVKALRVPDEEWWKGVELNWIWGKDLLREVVPEHAEELIGIISQWYPPKEVILPPYEWQ